MAMYYCYGWPIFTILVFCRQWPCITGTVSDFQNPLRGDHSHMWCSLSMVYDVLKSLKPFAENLLGKKSTESLVRMAMGYGKLLWQTSNIHMSLHSEGHSECWPLMGLRQQH
eukprot:2367900-Amphidinium_carterae.1